MSYFPLHLRSSLFLFSLGCYHFLFLADHTTMAFLSSTVTLLRRTSTLPVRRFHVAQQVSEHQRNFTSSCMSTTAANSSSTSPTATATTTTARVHVAVGSNLGNRFENLESALQLLSNHPQIQLLHTSMLHETSPMYVTDQPSFLNGVVQLETQLEPLQLLDSLKSVEAQLGRDLQGGIRNGPRPVDLDILFYQLHTQNQPMVMDTPRLTLPHPRMAEREFVLAPLVEVLGHSNSSFPHPLLPQSIPELLDQLLQQSSNDQPERVVVLPLPRDRMLYLNDTLVMGILNVTPDSFSDGGKFSQLDAAVQRALQMEQEGAAIIDIGGESTRPGAQEVAIAEEYQRTIPVIERIRQGESVP
jgi:2-amino-4-hydroxy-6-hydroxymethyldihydropteridine diphosphokinase